jgi:hypothetical protein
MIRVTVTRIDASTSGTSGYQRLLTFAEHAHEIVFALFVTSTQIVFLLLSFAQSVMHVCVSEKERGD